MNKPLDVAPVMVPILKGFPADFKEWLNKQREGKKTVAIVGFAPTSRALAPYDESKNNEDIEIWGLNEAYRHNFMVDSNGEFTADRWFQIHKPWSYKRPFNRNHPNHWLWLKNEEGECMECKGTGTKQFIGPEHKAQKPPEPCEDCEATGIYKPKLRKNFPIYMQKVDPEVPGSVEIPLQEIIDEFLTGHIYRGNNPVEYFTSSFAYICSLAMYLFKDRMEKGELRIEVYGFEMSTATEYHFQKGSTEFWLGMARGRGVDIFLPHECQLLKGAKYGYEVTQMINRQELEARQRQLKEIENQKVAALNAVSGRRQETEQEMNSLNEKMQAMKAAEKLSKKEEGKLEVFQEQWAEKMAKRQELMQQEINALSEANAVGGASQEIQALINYVDAQYNLFDAEMPTLEPKPSIMSQPVEMVGPKPIKAEGAENGKGQEEAEN